MKLIVGLGNPGAKYSNTRHNAGFMVLDQIARKENLVFKKNRLYDAVEFGSLVLVKPTIYMNDSGRAITSAITVFRPEAILVVVDDIHLPSGKIRLRDQGGDGGHNGLKSISEAVGGKQFSRIRIGVNKPESGSFRGWVLNRFSQEEMKLIAPAIDLSAKLVRLFE